MINNLDFTKRLKKIIDHYGESASSFAENIGVQRSSISHILSGRNKPSLEFVLKILSSFPEVELYWLMNGKGTFPAEKKIIKETIKPPIPQNQNLFSQNENLFTNPGIQNSQTQNSETNTTPPSGKKEIERIVVFYKDGSFSNYENF